MTRLELVVLFAVLFLLALLGLRWGWQARAGRQSQLPPLPVAPDGMATAAELAPELTGLYVGTTIATEWQNRVVVHTLGQRSDAHVQLSADGVLITRQGTKAIYLPAAVLVDARLEPALAGKVVGAGGLLVLRWWHGDVLLDTGIRADDKSLYPQWVAAVNQLSGHRTDKEQIIDE